MARETLYIKCWNGADIIEMLIAGTRAYAKRNNAKCTVIATYPDNVTEAVRRIRQHAFTPLAKPTFNGIDILACENIPVDEIRFY